MKFSSHKAQKKEETKTEQDLLREQKDREIEEKLKKTKEEEAARRAKFEARKLEREKAEKKEGAEG